MLSLLDVTLQGLCRYWGVHVVTELTMYAGMRCRSTLQMLLTTPGWQGQPVLSWTAALPQQTSSPKALAHPLAGRMTQRWIAVLPFEQELCSCRVLAIVLCLNIYAEVPHCMLLSRGLSCSPLVGQRFLVSSHAGRLTSSRCAGGEAEGCPASGGH